MTRKGQWQVCGAWLYAVYACPQNLDTSRYSEPITGLSAARFAISAETSTLVQSPGDNRFAMMAKDRLPRTRYNSPENQDATLKQFTSAFLSSAAHDRKLFIRHLRPADEP